MLNKSIDECVYSKDTRVFTIFNHFSPLKSHHARIKLICKVGNFNLLLGERGACVRMRIRIQDSNKFVDVDVAHPYLLGDVNIIERGFLI